MRVQDVDDYLDLNDQQIDKLVREKMRGDQKLQYHEALKLVASENPDLDRRRARLYQKKG